MARAHKRGKACRRVAGLLLAGGLLTLNAALPLRAVASASRRCPTIDPGAWQLPRLAASLLVIPVDLGAIASVRSEVASGAGGIILTGSDAPANLGAALRALGAAAPGGIPPLVMTDEEGGEVQRLTAIVGSIPSARTMGATMTSSAITSVARRIARLMRAAGITMDLAPVLDADGRPGPSATNPDGDRSFSAVVQTAGTDGLAFAAGLREGGVIPVVKHFPGLGGSTGNSDLAASSTLAFATLRTTGLVPFERAIAAGIPAVMVSNDTIPGLSRLPASVSPIVITNLLRHSLGFEGLVVTDSLSAISLSAAGYTVPAATVAALRAGADLVLFNAAPASVAALTRQIVATIEGAVRAGQLTRAALVSAARQVIAAKRLVGCAP